MKMQRLFRATFVDSFSQNAIVVEFDAPYPIDPKVDYAKLAVQELNDMIKHYNSICGMQKEKQWE